MTLSDSDTQKIALFFIFSFLDQKRAPDLSLQAQKLIQKKKLQNPGTDTDVLIVTSTLDIWRKEKGNSIRGRPNISTDSGYLFPDGSDLGPWKEFQKNAQEEELLATVWNMLMDISEDDISKALGLSAGTVRYRVGRALRKLGSYQPVTSGRGNVEKL